ncbi:MAG: YybH family protein [Actinomycetaceae bacterium]
MGHATPTDLLTAYVDAVTAGDVEALLSCYAEDTVVLDAFAPLPFDGRAEWREHVTEWLGGQGTDGGAELGDVTVLEAEDLAAVHGLVRFYMTGEEAGEIWNRYSAVLRHDADGWVIVHEHTSVPVDLETGMMIGLDEDDDADEPTA